MEARVPDPMADIILTTLNARYAHASFGLRYLLANMGELAPRTQLLEFVANAPITGALSAIVERNPRIVGIGVYIWNVEPATRFVAALKAARPEITVVIGGPEVSYEVDQQEIVRLADHVVTGEADLAFAGLCRDLLDRPGTFPRLPRKVIEAPVPALDRVSLPYALYTDEDLAHRVMYVEASRGCPCTCEFCLLGGTWRFPCGSFRSTHSWPRCSLCLTAARDNSNLSTGRSI